MNDEEGLVWGVYVGGCVEERGAWRLWHEQHGHAHNDTTDPWFGWICILDVKDVITRAGNPTQILLHEYAHLLAPNQGHSVKWKRITTELGAGREVERVAKINVKGRMPSVARSRREQKEELKNVAAKLR